MNEEIEQEILFQKYDEAYDQLFCQPLTVNRRQIDNYNRNVNKLLQLQPTNNRNKQQIVYLDEIFETLVISEENIEKHKGERAKWLSKIPNYELGKNFTAFNSIYVHEEILWLINANYNIESSFISLMFANDVEWNIGEGESHKSPDLIFYFDNFKIGVEVTRTRPNMLLSTVDKPITHIPSHLVHQWKNINQHDAMFSAIDKKNAKNGYIACDEYFLVILTNPMGGSKKEFASKAYMQLLADVHNEKIQNKKFVKVLIA